MRKYLIGFFVLFLPITTFASNDLLVNKKFSVIEEADQHKIQALEALKAAEEMSILIPILEDRRSMMVLVSSVAVALASPDATAKAKLLIIGLPLLASISGDLYDKLCDYRLTLVTADYHIEMFNFYNRLSIKMSERAVKDKDIQACLQAIDCLTFCQLLAFSTNDEIGKTVIESIKGLRDDLKEGFEKNKWKVSKAMIEDAWGFYENMSEMLAECEDEILLNKLFINTHEMIINLEAAYRISKRGKEEKNGAPVIING